MKKELTELEIAQREITKLKNAIERKDNKIKKLEDEIETYKIRKLTEKRDELLHQIDSLERIQRNRVLDPVKVVDVPEEFKFSIYDALAALSYSKDENLQFTSVKYDKKGKAKIICILSYGCDPIYKKYGVLKNFHPNDPTWASLVQDVELPGYRIGLGWIGIVANGAIEFECNDPNAIDYVLRAYQAEVDSGMRLFQFDDQNENPEWRIEQIQEALGLIENAE